MAHKLSADIASLNATLALVTAEVTRATGQLKARLRVIETDIGKVITSLTKIDGEIHEELDAERLAKEAAQEAAAAAREAEQEAKRMEIDAKLAENRARQAEARALDLATQANIIAINARTAEKLAKGFDVTSRRFR